MKYVCLFCLFCVGGFLDARPMKDIVTERMREYAAHPERFQHPAPKAKPVKKAESKPVPPPVEPKKEVKKKAEKKKEEKKEEKDASNGGGSKSSSKDEDAEIKEPAKGEEEKKEKKKSERKKPGERKPPAMHFLPDPRDRLEPVHLNGEQSQAIDALIREGKVADAKQLYRESAAAPVVDMKNGVEQVDFQGLSKGAAAIQLMHYLEEKKETRPFTVKADPETKEYLNGFVHDHLKDMWVSAEGDEMEISFKGSMVGNNAKYSRGKNYTRDSLEQLICMRALDGRKVPVKFKVVKDEQNKPVIQAHFKDAEDASSLAKFINGEVGRESSTYYVTLKEGKSKMILPDERKDYYASVAESLERTQEIS